MESKAQTQLRPKIYYAKEGKPFIEKNTRKAYKVEKNNYYFKLPIPEEMQYVRFDPARVKSDISIKKITLATTKWFQTKRYDVPTTNVIPVHQIENFRPVNHTVHFSTSGNDPQFHMRLSSTLISTAYHSHFYLLLVSLILVSVLFFLSYIYKRKTEYYHLNPQVYTEEYSICQK